MFEIVSLGIVILIILIHIAFTRKPRNFGNILEIILLDYIIFAIGIGQTLAGLEHIFNGAQIARGIGWPPGSPFQYEVGVANIAIGLTALLGARFRGTYWLAVALVGGIFGIGAGIGHVRDLMLNGNTAAYNAGPILYLSDGLLPLIIIILVIVYLMKKSAK